MTHREQPKLARELCAFPVKLKQCLLSDVPPAAPDDCEYCGYIDAVNSSLRQIERIEVAA